jgi:hypothetical protein
MTSSTGTAGHLQSVVTNPPSEMAVGDMGRFSGITQLKAINRVIFPGMIHRCSLFKSKIQKSIHRIKIYPWVVY